MGSKNKESSTRVLYQFHSYSFDLNQVSYFELFTYFPLFYIYLYS